jgi:hypothetical protein
VVLETRYTGDSHLHNQMQSKWYHSASPDKQSCANYGTYPRDRSLGPLSYNSSGVTSYRGKQQWVKINGKRRKKYNAFERWKHTCVANDMYKFCSRDETLCYRVVEFAMSRLLRDGSRALISTTPQTRYSGSECETSCLEGMRILATRSQKPIISELFAKANAPLFDGAVFVAELHETIFEIKRMLMKPALKLNKVHKDRSFDWTRPYKPFLNNPEEWWLWYRYFLLPAMLSVEDLIEAFMKKHDPITRVQDGIDQTSWYSKTGTLTDNNCSYNQPAGSPVVDIHWNSEYRYRGGGAVDFHYRHDPHKFGFGAYDLIRAAWERTPWSFVIDWFLDVGGWLASWRSIDLEIAQSYSTIVVEAETTLSGVDPYTWHLAGQELKSSMVLVQRVVDLEPPLTPCFNNEKLSLIRSIDACSLTLGFVKRVIQMRKR